MQNYPVRPIIPGDIFTGVKDGGGGGGLWVVSDCDVGITKPEPEIAPLFPVNILQSVIPRSVLSTYSCLYCFAI